MSTKEARVVKMTPSSGKGVESYEDRSEESRRKRRASAALSLRLTEVEIGELEYLWHGYAAELGCRSVHGAMEAQLLRSPPKDDARKYLLDELERAGGRASEGKLFRVVAAEWAVTRYEMRRAIHYLILHGKVERVEVPMPEGSAPSEEDRSKLTAAQREWTGYDLRLCKRKRLKASKAPASKVRAVRPKRSSRRTRELFDVIMGTSSGPEIVRVEALGDESPPSEATRDRETGPPATLDARQARWKRQDEALERECLMMAVSDKNGGRRSYEPDEMPSTARALTILAAVERIPAESAIVLRAVYGGSPNPYAHVYGRETGCVAAMTPAIRAERTRQAEHMAAQRPRGGRSWVEALAYALKETRPENILCDKADDKVFVGKVRTQAEQMIIRACGEYRKAREGRYFGSASGTHDE